MPRKQIKNPLERLKAQVEPHLQKVREIEKKQKD
jgi:hypothetical protein